jgi:hemolysin III
VKAGFEEPGAMALVDLFTADQIELEEHYPSRAEHTADLIVHLIGLAAAAIGIGVLFSAALMKGGVPLLTAIALYAVCLLAMLACSAVYNLTRPSAARRVLRRLDEAAIFLMIAGSYTPFAMQLLPAQSAFCVAAGAWVAALAGAAGKVLLPQISDRAWCFVYLAFGWAAVMVMFPAAHGLSMIAVALLAAGGLFYSGGVAVYLNPALPFRRAIWHGIVVVGAGFHYAAIMVGVVLHSM